MFASMIGRVNLYDEAKSSPPECHIFLMTISRKAGKERASYEEGGDVQDRLNGLVLFQQKALTHIATTWTFELPSDSSLLSMCSRRLGNAWHFKLISRLQCSGEWSLLSDMENSSFSLATAMLSLFSSPSFLLYTI